MRRHRVAAVTTLAALACCVATPPAVTADADPAPDFYCRLFEKVRDNLAIRVGLQVDRLTRFDGIEVMCDHKAIVFRQNVGLPSGEIGGDWLARRQKHWSKTYCRRHPTFTGAMRAGWTISTVMHLADGQALRFDAACHDADA